MMFKALQVYYKGHLRSILRCNILKFTKCILKTVAFLFWAGLYCIVMRLTIFKDSIEQPKSLDNNIVRPNETKLRIIEWTKEVDLWQSYTEEQHFALVNVFEERNNLLRNTCRKYNIDTQTIRSEEFFIHQDNSLVWCNVFKAASSFWTYNFNILGGYSQKFLAKTSKNQLSLARRNFKRPNKEELLEELKNPGTFSFMTVREPFVRLLSAYRDKLERFRHPFYRNLSRHIVKEFRDIPLSELSHKQRKSPTFKEFVLYIIDAHKKNKVLDEHWAPYYTFCSPCAVNFTVIAHTETFERDNMYIIRETGLEYILSKGLRTIVNRSVDGKNTSELVSTYFKQLDENILEDLMDIYRIDFEMFGYDSSFYNEIVQSNKFT